MRVCPSVYHQSFTGLGADPDSLTLTAIVFDMREHAIAVVVFLMDIICDVHAHAAVNGHVQRSQRLRLPELRANVVVRARLRVACHCHERGSLGEFCSNGQMIEFCGCSSGARHHGGLTVSLKYPTHFD